MASVSPQLTNMALYQSPDFSLIFLVYICFSPLLSPLLSVSWCDQLGKVCDVTNPFVICYDFPAVILIDSDILVILPVVPACYD